MGNLINANELITNLLIAMLKNLKKECSDKFHINGVNEPSFSCTDQYWSCVTSVNYSANYKAKLTN